MSLPSVEEARERMLAPLRPQRAERIDLGGAVGRTLVGDVQATRPQPPFDASAMDGWALAAASSPGTLAIVGESAAGRGFEGVVGAGEAVRIFTGAAVPAGADTVVIQEEARRQFRNDHPLRPHPRLGRRGRRSGRGRRQHRGCRPGGQGAL